MSLGRWEVGKVGEWWVERWEVPGFIQGKGRRVSPRFHFFVFDVNQGNKETESNCHWNCMYLFEEL